MRITDDELFFDEESFKMFLAEHPFPNYTMARRVALHRAMDGGDDDWDRPTGMRPYSVIQFWDTKIVPDDVSASIDRNRRFFGEASHVLFDVDRAADFISRFYSRRVVDAFAACTHPAMSSDVFRLAFLYALGGVYVDADIEVLSGFGQGLETRSNCIFLSILVRKKDVQPDGSWHWYSLADLRMGQVEPDAVCYFQNDVLAVTQRNEIVRLALLRAITLIERARISGERVKAHATTGPTNLTIATLIHFVMNASTASDLSDVRVFDRALCLHGGPYDYKRDSRNWQVADA